MNFFEFTEDLLDEIAAERNAAAIRQAAASSRLVDARASNDHEEMSRASGEINRHMEAAVALGRVLRKCQARADEFFKSANGGDPC